MKREGSLDAPTRHVLKWEDPDFSNKELLDAEMERVLDICHGCRRCFNLCGSFPKLFDLIDDSATGEIDGVLKESYADVVDLCTLCDMCFSNKCPYVPPHDFDIDFPHLMLRYKAYQHKEKQVSFSKKQLAEVDRNASVFNAIAPLVNTANAIGSVARPLIQATVNIHVDASIPKFAGKTLMRQVKDKPFFPNPEGAAYGEKVIIYATCFANYNETKLGLHAGKILAHQGIDVRFEYPGCCGMPQLELGNIGRVTNNAHHIAAFFEPFIDDGYSIVSLVPSCTFMLKSEWPLMAPESGTVLKLSKNTFDISEYIVLLSKQFGLAKGLTSLGENVTLHLACHARAQNMGAKAAEMLRLIPDIKVDVIERCSGHGGTWGMMVDTFDIALKIGKPVVNQAMQKKNRIVSSECPLAAEHIQQGLQRDSHDTIFTKMHPLEIFARAYGFHSL